MEFRFILDYLGVETILATSPTPVSPSQEPDGVKNIDSVIERDFKNHGVFFEFTDGDLKLNFVGEGRTIFETARDNEGIDALVTYKHQERADEFNDWVTIYEGKAVMDNLVITDLEAQVDFQETNVLTDIHNNLDTKVNFDDTTDIFGNAVTPLTARSVALNGRVLTRISLANMAFHGGLPDGRVYQGAKDGIIGLYASVNNILTAERNEVKNQDGSLVFNTLNAQADFIDDDFYFKGQFEFDPNTIGETEILVTLNFRFNADVTGVGMTGALNFKMDKIEQEGTADETITTTTIRAYGPGSEGDITNELVSMIPQSHTITDQPTIFRFRVDDNTAGFGGGDSMTVWFTTFNFTITQTSTGVPRSFAQMHYIFDAVDKNLEYITGQTGLLNSDFFGVGGAAEQMAETNGYKIRQADYPIIGTLRDRLDSINAIFGTGYGFEVDAGYELTRVRLEPLEHFYADEELVSFSNIEIDSYEEEFYEPLNFNRIDIGYEKFSDDEDEPASLNDVNTIAQYKTPVSRLEDSYVQESKYIASDILGEVTRRLQFTNPNESGEYDDDLFIFDIIGTYDGLFEPREDDIVNVSNVPNSGTGYNFRLNPRFNLWNHASIINSAVYKKEFTDSYSAQFFKNNNGQSRKISYNNSATDQERLIGDPTVGNANSPNFDESFTVGRFNGGLRLFDPILIKFKVGMSSAEKETIRKAHRNQLDSGNYGYITVTKPDGNQVSGWLIRLAYNNIDKIGNFQILKRNNNYLP